MIPKGEKYDPGDGYFLKFCIGVGPGGFILAPIIMNVVYPGERLSCSLVRRMELTCSWW